MYAVIGEKAAYIIFIMFLGMVRKNIKGQKIVQGVLGVCSRTEEGHTKCDSPGVVKSAITLGSSPS